MADESPDTRDHSAHDIENPVPVTVQPETRVAAPLEPQEPRGPEAEDKKDEHSAGDGDGRGDDEGASENGDEEEEEEEEDEDDDDDEPRLKYARLTQHLGPLYRNGDATSAFLVAGDKMV